MGNEIHSPFLLQGNKKRVCSKRSFCKIPLQVITS
jgi:hypothetical protein